MITVNDLVEDWIEIRSKLQQQLKALDSGQLRADDAITGATAEVTKAQIKKWLDELNALLKEYAKVHPT